jgi:uncharacterized protein
MALTPEERQAITNLFDRLRENGLVEKDSEAEALINQLIRRTPDSTYMLVQSVLIQEQQIDEYEGYMDQQEERIKELEEQLSGGCAPAQGSSGGFLGGARRGAAPSPRDTYQDDRGSGMPSIGSRSGPSRYETSSDRQPEQPWRGRDPSYASDRGGPGMGVPQGQQPPQQGGGGGFLRTAAAMAAGVAGGALLTNSLGGMFGGKGGEAKAGQADSSSTPNEVSHRDSTDNDPGNYDSNVHEAGVEEGDWGAGDDDMDLDI